MLRYMANQVKTEKAMHHRSLWQIDQIYLVCDCDYKIVLQKTLVVLYLLTNALWESHVNTLHIFITVLRYSATDLIK